MIATSNDTVPDFFDVIRKEAYRGARSVLRFPHEKTICVDIASDAVENAIRNELRIEKPAAWGRTFGHRKAVSYVRKCNSERRYKQYRRTSTEHVAKDYSLELQRHDQASSIAHKALDILAPKEALYVLSCTLCEYDVGEIGLIVDNIEQVARPKASHKKQLNAAIKKLRVIC